MAFKRWIKAPSKKTPQRTWSQDEMKMIGWCLNKNIKIAVIPNGTKWQVEININKSIHLDSKIYEADEAYKKMYEYYKYYYDKHSKQQKV